MSHLQNCSLKIYLKRAPGGGRVVGLGGQDGCERRIKGFFRGGGRVGGEYKIQKRAITQKASYDFFKNFHQIFYSSFFIS